MIVNYEPTKTGKVRAVCCYCDRRSRPVDKFPDGRPAPWALARWASAPYPVTCQHDDGSFGTVYTCPSCMRLRDDRRRDGITPLLVPTAARVAAARAANRGQHL